MKKRIITILICTFLTIILTGCKPTSDYARDKDETENYGTVEKESVELLVAKFNTEVMDNSKLDPASSDYLTESDNNYWYGLMEGISLVVVPQKYTGNQSVDIVDYMLIYVDKSTNYTENVIPYTKHLIKANNAEITETEIESLIKEAKTKASSGKTAQSGKGIAVGYREKDEMYQYQVLRIYKWIKRKWKCYRRVL